MTQITNEDRNYKIPEGFQIEQLQEIEINIPTTPGATSAAVQEVWNEQVAIINEIVNDINAGTAVGDDLYELLDALNELIDLAKNGVTDENGNTSYLTDRMADALKMMLIQFAMVGIRPNMTVPQENPLAVLNGAKAGLDENGNPIGPYEDPLQIAVLGATNLTYENLDVQNYLYATVIDKIMPVYEAQFEELYNFLEMTDEVLQVLDSVLVITTYVEIPDPWTSSMSLENPGDISPDAAEDINDYIMKNTDASDKDDAYARGFYAQYQSELSTATANAAANGTTVQYEMSQLQGGWGSSTDRLRAFMKEDESRVSDVAQIMANASVTQVEGVPTPPEGMTMTEVGENLWDAKTELDALIVDLKAQNADPKLYEALEKISADIETAWNSTIDLYVKNGNNLGPAPYTPESIKKYAPEFYEGVMRDFADQFIKTSNESKSGGSTVTHIEDAISRFESFNEEQLKNLQKLMVAMEQLMKMVGSLLKTLNDIYMAYIKNYAR